jgi:hypothetical protein
MKHQPEALLKSRLAVASPTGRRSSQAARVTIDRGILSLTGRAKGEFEVVCQSTLHSAHDMDARLEYAFSAQTTYNSTRELGHGQRRAGWRCLNNGLSDERSDVEFAMFANAFKN